MKFSTAVMQILSVLLITAVTGHAGAQPAYPSKPIRIIAPNPPGGGTTITGRLVGQKLTESWGQPVLIDNRPGGNGFIGGEALAKSPPDGHTIMVMTRTHIITPMLIPSPYDPIRDFSAVATLAKSELVLLIHPSVPANNLREFIALAKSKPGELNQGSPGEGSPSRLAAALFEMMTGTRMQNISYKGSALVTTDLLGGQIQLSFNLPATDVHHIKSGRLRAIAISGETRSSTLPQVPTFTEAGLPGFDVRTWYGVLAPAGTTKAIINKLSTEIGRILAMTDIQEKIAAQGMEPFVSTPEQFGALMKAETVKYAKVIKIANIRIGN